MAQDVTLHYWDASDEISSCMVQKSLACNAVAKTTRAQDLKAEMSDASAHAGSLAALLEGLLSCSEARRL